MKLLCAYYLEASISYSIVPKVFLMRFYMADWLFVATIVTSSELNRKF